MLLSDPTPLITTPVIPVVTIERAADAVPLARALLAGGLSVVDARDVAALLPVAMARGTAGARYLLGAVNWTFAEFFGRLERLTKIAGPKLKFSGTFPHVAARMQAEV